MKLGKPLRAYCAPPLLLGLLTGAAPAPLAQELPELAGPRAGLCPPIPAIDPLPEAGEIGEAIRVTADELISRTETLTTFRGNVIAVEAGRRLYGDQVDYHRPDEVVEVIGNVRIETPALRAWSKHARFELARDSGELTGVEYLAPTSRAFGVAERVEILDPDRTLLHDATYSTCPPEKRDWELKASEVKLDETTNTGEAWHSTLEFMGVPIFYTPYINFPLAGRKSGFLFPSFGNSAGSGADLAVPWYWNIAPNRDATLTPRWIERRGGMFMGEYRYLGERYSGDISLEYLPDDNLYGEDRHFGIFRHSHNPAPGWGVGLLYQEVSDREYFNDLDTSLATSSLTHLDRRFTAGYSADNWNFSALVQDYQTLSGSEPYRRLPQLRFSGTRPAERGEPIYSLAAEYVYWDHRSLEPTGSRVDLTPRVRLPLDGDWWSFTPSLSLRHTSYALENAAADNNLSRTVPVLSLDSTLFLEREFVLGGRPLMQTLEPRLFYLYAPYEDQSDLPVFDTGVYGFSFAQMFRENRFTGADRVSDANQITAAVTTRFIDLDSGAELGSASIGQIFYFDDRRVFQPETRSESDIVAEVIARPVSSLYLRSTALWDTENRRTSQFNNRIEYQPERGKAIGLGYRFTRGTPDLKQADLSVFWPITKRWHFISRWLYDLEAGSSLEQVAGLRYQDCCWAVDVVARANRDAADLPLDHGIFITLRLIGLSSIGRTLDSTLASDIFGYESLDAL